MRALVRKHTAVVSLGRLEWSNAQRGRASIRPSIHKRLFSRRSACLRIFAAILVRLCLRIPAGRTRVVKGWAVSARQPTLIGLRGREKKIGSVGPREHPRVKDAAFAAVCAV
jgi:hypothetical protein